ncbi:MAG: carbon monoxide dehydrogenase [Anaerolineaceae bacterium]|nr:carbon monoxide dehydrogenase [Anaerolineaceae bacterium]
MHSFTYVRPQSLEEASTFLSEHREQARILAGGTDLLVQIQSSSVTPDYIVDIKHIPELNVLSFDETGGLRIGAAVPCFKIWNHHEIAHLYPGLIDAVQLIGGTQIQGRATLGGNVANASPAADTIPSLIVHGAICDVIGRQGIRSIAVQDICIGPGQNALAPDEFLLRFQIKPPSIGFGAHYLRFIPRNEMDIAVASAGASLVLNPDDQTVQYARIAIGAVAPTPLLVIAAGESLIGQPLTNESIDRAARLAAQAAQPITDIRGTISQRKHLAAVLTRRALVKAQERALQSLKGASH